MSECRHGQPLGDRCDKCFGHVACIEVERLTLSAQSRAFLPLLMRDGQQAAIAGWSTGNLIVHAELVGGPLSEDPNCGAAIGLLADYELMTSDVLTVAYLTYGQTVRAPVIAVGGLAARQLSIRIATHNVAGVRVYVAAVPAERGGTFVERDERCRSYVGAFPSPAVAIAQIAQSVSQQMPGALVQAGGALVRAPTQNEIVPLLASYDGGQIVQQGRGARPWVQYASPARENGVVLFVGRSLAWTVALELSSNAPAARWLHVFNRTTLPTLGTAPSFPPVPISPGTMDGYTADVSMPLEATLGFVAAVSTTEDTYTAPPSAEGLFYAQTGAQ